MTILQKSRGLRKHRRWVSLLEKKHISLIHAEIQAANEQIDAMHTIVNDYGNKEHKAILNEHFGEHHNIDAIKKSVTLLKKGKVNVGAVSDAEIPEYVSAHTYMEPPQSIWFGPHFHSPKRTTQDTAGTILHEASHALLQTGDRYKRVGKGEDAHLVGIWINEYNELEKDKEQRKHLVRGCKFCILLDYISR